MADREYDRVDDNRAETVVVKDRPRRSAASWIIPLVVLLLLIIGAIYLFGGSNDSTTIDTPNSVTIPKPNVPDVDVQVNR